MAGGPVARLSCSMCLGHQSGSGGAGTGLGVSIYCMCGLGAALCRGMHNRIRGDLVRSSWYRDRGTAARTSVDVCGLCNRISCYLVWCSWCTGLNWTGLSWAEAGQRGALCACVCGGGSVVACIIGLGTTW